jgi:hypothetical protein
MHIRPRIEHRDGLAEFLTLGDFSFLICVDGFYYDWIPLYDGSTRR